MSTDSQTPWAAKLARRLAAAHAAAPSLDAAAKAKLCLIDFLSSAFVSEELPWSRQAIALAASAGTGTAGILGTRQRAAPGEAAFANAVLGHGLVRDDMHLGSVSHLGVIVMPTVLALAETESCSGSELLAAIVAGYEAGGKLGRAILDIEVSRIFRPTGIVGPFAAAAAGARLLRLNVDEFTNALALAANTSAGYNEWAATGGSEMFFHPGFAVRNAITSLALARAGAYCSPTAVDGPAGMFAAFGKPPVPDVPLPYEDAAEIGAVFFKEVPACNFAQSAAQAARRIAIANSLDAAAIDRIVTYVTHAAAHYPGCDCGGPFEHVLQAKMSIQYNVAAALRSGNFNEENYDPLTQSAIAALATRVSIEVDDALTAAYPQQQGAEVAVHLGNGEILRQRVADVEAADPAAVRDRFQRAASARLGPGPSAELEHLIDALERQSDARAAIRLMHG